MVIIALTIQLAIIFLLGVIMLRNIKRVIKKSHIYQTNIVQEKNNSISFKDSLLKINAPVIKVRINNKKYDFLIDTGADRNYIDAEAFKELSITSVNIGETAATAAGVIDTPSTTIPFKIGNSKFTEQFNLVPITKNLKEVLMGSGFLIQGVLGCGFFKENRWKFDFENMVIWTK